jgi:proteasome lid subunit RPN8/RPN11
MEDSPPLNDIIDKAKLWLRYAPRDKEPCAVAYLQKGKLHLKVLENTSTDPKNYFVVDKDYVRLSLTGEILYIIHAHPDNCIPSEYDIAACNSINIPYIVFNHKTLEYQTIYPLNYKTLSGIPYEFGVADCFETARSWYLMHGVPIPPRKDWIDDWWEEGYDYIKDLDKSWPFVESKGLTYGSLITFNIQHEKENHLGIYLGQDCFFHHAVDRLSCKENLYPFWGKFIKKVYNYEGSITKRFFG